MKCKYHPDYDPANSGEPTSPVRVKIEPSLLVMGEWVEVPCPYCWQIYGRHLSNLINEEDIEAEQDKIMLDWLLENILVASPEGFDYWLTSREQIKDAMKGKFS